MQADVGGAYADICGNTAGNKKHQVFPGACLSHIICTVSALLSLFRLI